ncbi:hypothetical protein AB4X15_24700 [Peribacillus simplex]|uniref:hypothetical protein n=1 Tax=Peribacillus TaxID=2675229 RepID=UPI001783E4CE|nr:hypothetical protein [Brevibacillus sp. JNUCC-41]QOS91709.1 hypothetical protein JNUCC41_08395 [Brevibacillus sp. JNUCC-41]
MEVWREILCIWSKYSWVWTLLVDLESNTREFYAFTREFGANTREFRAFTREFRTNTREFRAFTREFGANTREFRAFTREFGGIVWFKPGPCPALRGRCFKAINKKETPLLKSGASDIRSLRCGMISFEQIHISEFS